MNPVVNSLSVEHPCVKVDPAAEGVGAKGPLSSRAVVMAASPLRTVGGPIITTTPHPSRPGLAPLFGGGFQNSPSQAAGAIKADEASRGPLQKRRVKPFEKWKEIYGEELVQRFVKDEDKTYTPNEMHDLFNKVYFYKQWEAQYGRVAVEIFIPDDPDADFNIPWMSQQLRDYEIEREKSISLLRGSGLFQKPGIAQSPFDDDSPTRIDRFDQKEADQFLHLIASCPEALIQRVDALLEETYGKGKTHPSQERVRVAALLAPLSERIELYIELKKQTARASEFLRFIQEELNMAAKDFGFAVHPDDFEFMVHKVFPHYLSGEMSLTPKIKTEIIHCLCWMANSRSLAESWEKIFGFNQFDAAHKLIYNIDTFRDHLSRELEFKTYLMTIEERTSWEQLKLRAKREGQILGHLSLAEPEQLDLLQGDRNLPETATLIRKMRKKADLRTMDPSQLFIGSSEKRGEFMNLSDAKIHELSQKTEKNRFDETFLALHKKQALHFQQLSDSTKIESLERTIEVNKETLLGYRHQLEQCQAELSATRDRFLGQYKTDETYLYELALRPEADLGEKVKNQKAEIDQRILKLQQSSPQIPILQRQLAFLQWVEKQPIEANLASQFPPIAEKIRAQGKIMDQMDLLELQNSSLESQLKLLSPGMNGLEPQSKLNDIFVMPIGDVLYRSNDDKGKGGKYIEGKWAVADLRSLSQEKKKLVLKELKSPFISGLLSRAKSGKPIYFDLDAKGILVECKGKGAIALFYLLPSEAVQAYQSREMGIHVRVKKVDGCYKYTQPEEDSLFSSSKSSVKEDVLTVAIDSQIAILLTRKIMAQFIGPHPLSFKAYQNAIGHFYAIDQSDLAQVYYKKNPAFVEAFHLNNVTSKPFASLIDQIARVQKIQDELGIPYNPDAELTRIKDMAQAIKLYGDWAKEIDHFIGADVPKLLGDCEKEFQGAKPILNQGASKNLVKAFAQYNEWRIKMDAFIASEQNFTLQQYSIKFKSIRVDISLLEKLNEFEGMSKLIKAYKKWEEQIDQFLAAEKMATSLNMFATKFREIRPAFHLDKTNSGLEESFRDIAKSTMKPSDVAKKYTPEEQSFLISKGLNYVKEILGHGNFMAGLFFMAFCYNSKSLQLLTTKIMRDHKVIGEEQQEFNNMFRKVIQFHVWTSELLKKLMDGATELSPEFIEILNNNIKIQDDLRLQEILQTRMKQMLLSQPPEDLRSAMRFFRESKRAEQNQSTPVKTPSSEQLTVLNKPPIGP